MIKIINPDKLTAQPFFQDLVNYLAEHNDVILRQLKKDFPEQKNLDRHLEDYIQAGYIVRAEKRYHLALPMLNTLDGVKLDQMVFVDDCSAIYQDLKELRFETQLPNTTNECVIIESTDFERQELTLSNYFYRLNHRYPLSEQQLPLYKLIGDVNAQYALKYVSTFLTKFLRKDVVKQKSTDIFCQTLVLLGYLEVIDEANYSLQMIMDKEQLIFTAKKP
ncbi:DUF1803 domain-containing protein [Streptococcus hongkongensis]|nr:hypothetical protein NC01_03225 [Streptococcus uberis]